MSDRRPRVVAIVTTLDLGGAQKTLVALAERYDRDAFELVVIAGSDTADSTIEGALRRSGVRIIRIASLRRAVSWRDLVALWALVRTLRAERPAVVHTHSSKAGVLGRAAGRLARAPRIVHTVHGWSFRNGQPSVVFRACVALERVLARVTDVIVAVADTDRRAGVDERIRPRTRYEVIRSGIDLEEFHPADERARQAARAALGIPFDVPVIGTVGRVAPQKDPETFLRAVARVAVDVPSVRAVVVGDGPSLDAAREQARELGIAGRVTFTGARADVASLVPAFDVYALASRWEGLPRGVIEAMATGVPVVATDVNGTGEVVRHGETGILVGASDSEALGDAIVNLLTDPARAEALAAAALARLEEFDAATMTARHEALYESLVPRGPVRVVHVITGLEAGGAENVLATLVGRMNRERVASHVISLTDLGPLASRVEAAGIPVEALGMARGRIEFRRVLQLRRRLRVLRPDVVQTWMYHADLIGGIAARLAGVREVVWNLRIAEPTAEHMKSRTGLVVRACALLSRVVPTEIVTVAESGIRGHRALGYAMGGARVVGNGVDVERFQPHRKAGLALRAELGIAADALLVSYVARFDPQKDHATFAAAAARIADARPDVRFVLCGAGCSPADDTLVDMCTRGGILARVSLLGVRPDVEAVCAASDVAVSSSLMEGFPNAIAEAMACGCCVVATDVGDTAHVIGHAGRVVPPADANALARAVVEVLELPIEARRALGCSARARVTKEFALTRSVAAYEALYSSAARVGVR